MRLPPGLEITARRALGTLLGPVLRRAPVFPARRAALLARLGVDKVVDVGANIGQYASQLRFYGYRGEIHSYEPLASAFQQLAAKTAADPRWHARHLGLGRMAGTATLHVAGNSQSSSLLEMLQRHVEVAPESAVVGQETVELTTISSVLSELGRCFVKIDTQGAERAILEGGGDLANACGLELELSLVPLYAGETLFGDMVAWLTTKQFELRAISPGIADPRTGAVLQVDALFARTT